MNRFTLTPDCSVRTLLQRKLDMDRALQKGQVVRLKVPKVVDLSFYGEIGGGSYLIINREGSLPSQRFDQFFLWFAALTRLGVVKVTFHRS